MLSVNINYFNKGIGKILLIEAENIGKRLGYKKSRVEVLAPNNFSLPSRDKLISWYS